MRFLAAGLAGVAIVGAVKAPGRSHRGPLDAIRHDLRKHGWSLALPLDASATPSTSSTDLPPFDMKVDITTTISLVPTSTPPYANSTASLGPAPSHLAADSAATEDGEVDANPEPDEAEYLSPVRIGGQLVNLNFDTGSADLWVYSNALPKNQSSGHSIYTPESSTTWEAWPGATWNITYGDGSGAFGLAGYDTVDVGESTVDRQCVGIAQSVSPAFVKDANCDGLLGLAFSSISTFEPSQPKTFFENLMDQLSEPLFTADLEETTGKGTYEFGTIDHTKHRGEIHYAPVNNSLGWWSIDTPSYKLGSSLQSCAGCQSIVDTGTTLVYLKSSIVKAYYAQIPGSWIDEQYEAVWFIPCNATMPDLSTEIGTGWYATVKGKDMVYGVSPDPAFCYGGLQEAPHTPFGPLQILGGVFLKQFFVVFDGGKMRLGVAEKD